MTTAAVFLLPNGTFFVELIIFVIVLGLITKFIVPPLNRAMAKRQEEIRTSLDAAERARQDAAVADDERRAALEEARRQARELVATANNTAEQIRSEAQTRAQEEYQRIVAGADAEIALARQRAVDEAAGRMGEVVLEVVERIIGREVDEASHRALIDDAIGALSSEAGGPAAAGAGQRP
jgi:F-type H+-transporting ATPase subunit b